MRAYHDSRELKFRSPFGAVPMGGAVSISVDTWDGEPEWAQLRVRVDKKGEKFITMDRQGGRFSCELTLDSADIYWYSFLFHFPDGGVCWYGPENGRVGGIGRIYGWDCPEYQITCYVPRPLPEWYRNAVCYQIFPDRFFRGPDWRELAEKALSVPRKGTPKAVLERWSTPVHYKRAPDGRIRVWDFYGGTLSGIAEKLDYLRGMGITAIYLNPIFEAASNHRYDTGDYRKIDPMLGDEQAFRTLCAEAKRRGIRIILDGVFNHTGCDSKYFNKYGNYPEPGAWQGPDSKYYKWFRFNDSPAGYECWWGIDDLPDVEEHDPGFQDYIYGGEDSVVRHWLRAGASGWRLDVADELPDDIIAGIKSAITAETGGDGLLLGEVWEDASNKVSYGQLRRYFLGAELDCTMNYPVRSAVLYFLLGSNPAWSLRETMLSLQENYPPEAFNGAFNLMGSHDRARLLTALGGAPEPEQIGEEEKLRYRLSDSQRGLAKGRLWLLALMQMTLPGVPCVYYGDEAGMEGYADPYNRGPYPWGREDRDCATIYRNAINLRRAFPELAGAGFTPFAESDDVFGYYRDWQDGALAVIINRGSQTRSVTIDRRGEDVTDILGGTRFEERDGRVNVTMWPMGSAILYFHKKTRLGLPLKRGSGVLAHITSIPNGQGRGNIGEPALRFVDWLASCRQRYWQILPLNPTDMHGSPYAGASAFAGNISLLPQSEEELREEFAAFTPDGEYADFLADNSRWLEPWALFMAIKNTVSREHHNSWPERYRRYSPDLASDPALRPEADFQRFCQYKFELAWRRLRAHALEKGVKIIGDVPMFVSDDSADVWAEPELFTVDGDGRATLVAGVQPSWMDQGQCWGNPIYDWDAMESTGFDWWMRRFERMLDLYDFTRLDHFMGFESAWAIPAGKKPADGHWIPGPGLRLFQTAYERFGPLPFIAEDLGSITPAIRALLCRCGFLGNDILQYQNSDPANGYYPAKDKVAYTGTHDNRTLVGFCREKYPDRDGRAMARELGRRLFESSADVVILPLQDVLELDDSARMNTPGTTRGNWSWQAKETDFKDASERLLSDTIKSNRS